MVQLEIKLWKTEKVSKKITKFTNKKFEHNKYFFISQNEILVKTN